MTLDTFKIFCDVVEFGSFSKAARLHSVTQSAVSQQIRTIEKQYNVVLLERGRRDFSLTPEGKVFLDATRRILSIYEHLEDRINELHHVIAGTVKISSVHSIGLHELPPYLKHMLRAFPGVDVQVKYRRSSHVYEQVLNGEADIGLVACPVRRNGIVVEEFLEDKMTIICPPLHRLAERRSASVKELDGEDFIAFEPDLPTRRMIDRYLKANGVAVRTVMEFDNIETVKRAVEIENGISIVPEKTVEEEVVMGTLSAVSLEKPEIKRPLGIITRARHELSPAQTEFVRLLKKGLDA